MKFLITIDTEWDRHSLKDGEITVENLSALPGFHAMCLEEGIRPCYLCAHEAALSPDFEAFGVKVLSGNEGEIGTHLHPWSTPPYVHDTETIRKRCPFPNEYPVDVFGEKLTSLKHELENRFGDQTTYRGGRFGFSTKQAPVLSRAGYTVDTSVTPYVSWVDTPGLSPNGGPDYTGYTEAPFVWESTKTNERPLLEIPVTVLKRGSKAGALLQKAGKPGRIIAGMLDYGVFWFRPLPESLDRLNLMVDRAERKGFDVVNMMMHSNEFDHRCNPYYTTEEAVSTLLSTLKDLFRHINRKKIVSVTPREYYEFFMQHREPQ